MIDLKEEFRPINGYEGLYEIGSFGTVISLRKTYGRCVRPGRYVLVKQRHRDGYNKINLYKNGKMKSFCIHRLVAKAFIPNPENLSDVNHKNGIKTDDRVDNLEWCTEQYNTKHAYDNNLGNLKYIADLNLKQINRESKYILIILLDSFKNLYCFKSTKEAAKYACTNYDRITEGLRKNQRVCGYKVYGYKRKDLEQFANGEPLPDVLKGIPWESYLNDNQSCNDYPSEGE